MKFTENGLHRNVGRYHSWFNLSPFPHPCLLPLPALWILVWVSSSYVHANKINEIHNTAFENLLRLVGLARQTRYHSWLIKPAQQEEWDILFYVRIPFASVSASAFASAFASA